MITRIWNNSNSHPWLVGMQNGTATLEDSLRVSYRTIYTLSIQPNNYIPWYLLKASKAYVHTEIRKWMFTAGLFIIAKTWKQPKCPSVIGEGINKLCYI